uniref:RING-type domain-containing protein n=1 Tax=Aegilops tauschii subsp. strangulata TaxID=200361 RepID=A0A453KX39_AEGTS
ICIFSCRMDDDFAAAEAEQLEEVLRLSAQSATMACAVCRLMTVSLEASWKPENCDHVICIDCFAKYTTETVATEMPKCPVASCKYHVDPEIHEFMEVDDDGSLIAIKEIDDDKGKQPCNDVLQELGQCSSGTTMANDFYCTICMEEVPAIECFPVDGCTHAFCVSCVRQYIAAKVEENVLPIRCPDLGCEDGTLQPEACRDVIPTPLFQRWGAALCDMALEGIKFYCPFNDCSTTTRTGTR